MSKAYLTIDDISSELTKDFIDYVVGKGITPIMFAVGENLEKYFEEAVYALRKGAIVGNHTYSHRGFSQISFEECTEEIQKCEVLLNKVYEAAGMERKYKIFRFPYGDRGNETGERIQTYLKENNFCRIDDSAIYFDWYKEYKLNEGMDIFWTFDFEEYQLSWDNGYNYESIKQKINDKNPDNGGALLEEGSMHIVLIHDIPDCNRVMPDYYKTILDYVISLGVEFITPQFIV